MIRALGGAFVFVARVGPARVRGTGRVFVQTFFGLRGLWAPKK